MDPRDPPLNAVRAFAAAARHESFTLAAHELNVTHGAVSRQVKALEEFLGVRLFDRSARRIALTAHERQFHGEVQPALEQIGAVSRAFRGQTKPRTVTINVRPSFAVRWLIPRLPSFIAQWPQVEPRVITSTVAPADAEEVYDIALRRGLAGWPAGVTPQRFIEDEAVVVGSPALLGSNPLRDAGALSSHVLLSAKTRASDWDDWRRRMGVPRRKPAGRLQFDHLHFVLQAALDGMGVALAPASLVTNDLACGRLLAPLPDLRLPLPQYFYGVAPGASPDVDCVVRWLEGMVPVRPGSSGREG